MRNTLAVRPVLEREKRRPECHRAHRKYSHAAGLTGQRSSLSRGVGLC